MKKLFGFIQLSLALLILMNSTFAIAQTTYVRGKILHFISNPDTTPKSGSYQFLTDGLLIIEDGTITKLGNWEQLKKDMPPNAKLTWYKNGLILPGFIDTHIHYPQLDMIAANSGDHLLQWLNKYTFPFEKKISNQQYAEDVANFFIDELLRNGTTTNYDFCDTLSSGNRCII